MKVFILAGVLLILTTACSQMSKKQISPDADWQTSMQSMGKHFRELYPLVLNEKEFYKDSNSDRIKEGVEALHQDALNIIKQSHKTEAKLKDPDPSLKYISASFARELEMAGEGLKDGKKGFSRALLRRVPNYCIQCHTRDGWGPSLFEKTSLSQFNLAPLEEGEYYLALRDFNKAEKVFSNYIKDPKKNKEDPHKWALAAKALLNLQVRVRRDPQLVLKTLEVIKSAPIVPRYLDNDLKFWKSSTLYWASLKKVKPDLKFIKKLVLRSKKNSLFVSTEPGYIDMLLASSLLHELVRNSKNNVTKAEAYYMMARLYDHIKQTGFEFMELGEEYYKSCIFTAPATPIAMKCYEGLEAKYEMSRFLGMGRYMTRGMRSYLSYLKNIAQKGQVH